MAIKHMQEGDVKKTDLPCPNGTYQMIERMQFGVRTIAIEKDGTELSKVYVKDYTDWKYAFNAAMDKAGV